MWWDKNPKKLNCTCKHPNFFTSLKHCHNFHYKTQHYTVPPNYSIQTEAQLLFISITSLLTSIEKKDNRDTHKVIDFCNTVLIIHYNNRHLVIAQNDRLLLSCTSLSPQIILTENCNTLSRMIKIHVYYLYSVYWVLLYLWSWYFRTGTVQYFTHVLLHQC